MFSALFRRESGIFRMRRRDFILVLGGAVAAIPTAVRAQKTVPVIAILGSGVADAPSSRLQMTQLDAGMREIGLVAGRDYVFEVRWAGSDASHFSSLAAELLAKGPRAIVVSTNLAALAVQKLSSTVPIVGTGLNAPVATGLAASFAHPGGSITGVATMAEALQLKLLEMLRATIPGLRRVFAISNPTNPSHPAMLDTLTSQAKRDGLALEVLKVSAPADLDSAFAQMSNQPVSAVLVMTDNSLLGLAGAIITRALEARLPAVGNFAASFVQLGGLYAYGRDPQEAFYGVARLLKKILDGASPADIPFEQPIKFNLIINLKTAKLLGIEIPPTLLATASEVIE
jgi:putative tryptophan/tyrosine transport system substrate-binding protein